MISLALLVDHWRIPATDSVLSIATNLNKAYSLPSLTLKSIQHIPTCFLQKDKAFDKLALSLTPPLLVKPVCGRHGEGIQIMETADDVSMFLSTQHKDNLMLQSFLKIDEEYRVFVVGDQSLGVIKKIPKEGSVIANYAAGAQFVSAKVPEAIKAECIEICRQQCIDIGGVDLARIGDGFFLLEINRCPEFRAFSKAKDINVAEHIVKFITKK